MAGNRFKMANTRFVEKWLGLEVVGGGIKYMKMSVSKDLNFLSVGIQLKIIY